MILDERELERVFDDPRWIHVVAVALLTGEAPAQEQALLSRLLDEHLGDVFRHRLVLAAWALDGVGPALRRALCPVGDEVEKKWADWFDAWLRLLGTDSERFEYKTERSPDIDIGASILADLRPARAPAFALVVLTARIDDVWWPACRFTLSQLEAAAASDAVLARLRAGLEEPHSDARGYSAARVLALLGPAAATDEVTY